MRLISFIIAVWVSGQVFLSPAHSISFILLSTKDAIVCPASDTDLVPPGPTQASCEEMSFWQADPQNNHIWVYLTVQGPDAGQSDFMPLGLGLSAKASSWVFLNGVKLGENGLPADHRAQEQLGQMDIMLPIPPGVLDSGENIISLRLSSHRGLLTLTNPLHGVYLAPFAEPQASMLQQYWLSILPFGAFALGGVYFLVMAWRGRQRGRAGLLSAMAFFAAVQLFAEVSRGLFAYSYPMHDVRLMTILACSLLFGFCLLAYICEVFAKQYRVQLLGAGVAMTLMVVALLPGLDSKASFGVLIPTIFAALIALFFMREKHAQAGIYALALLFFAAINWFGAGQFLDLYFFYAVAALMIFLFTQQAMAYAKEQALSMAEMARADRLQYILDEQAVDDHSTITMTSTGQVSQIPIGRIAHIKGAGDYSEMILIDGAAHLHNATLNELETSLPAYFLRVHRSHIVNTKLIERLDRDPAGTGQLVLTTGQSVSVSRRIMPRVRKAFG